MFLLNLRLVGVLMRKCANWMQSCFNGFAFSISAVKLTRLLAILQSRATTNGRVGATAAVYSAAILGESGD